MNHHGCGFLCLRIAFAVHHVDEARFFKALQVIHYRCATRANLFCQLTYVGRRIFRDGKEVEQLLEAREVLQLNLLVEKHVHLNHVVHRLQQSLSKVAVFEEEGEITMVQVFLEILPGAHLGKDGLENLLVVIEQIVNRVGTEIVARLQIDVLAEREAMEYVRTGDA